MAKLAGFKTLLLHYHSSKMCAFSAGADGFWAANPQANSQATGDSREVQP